MALLWGKDDLERGAESVAGFLDVQMEDYDVVEWSDGLIRAISHLPVADIEIQISLSNEIATRLYRERADQTEKPISNHYVLE